MRVAQFNRYLLVFLVTTAISFLSSGTVQASDYTDSLPIPATKAGQDNYPLGVASYYGVFAGGDLTVGDSAHQLEGRIAAKSFDTKHDHDSYFENFRSDPVIVTNQLKPNAVFMMASSNKTASQNKVMFDSQNLGNKIVANNVFSAKNDEQLWSLLPSGSVSAPDSNVDINRLKDKTIQGLVSQRTSFIDNKSKLIGAKTENNNDDSSYFTAATEQLKKISHFYSTFTSDITPITYDKDTIDEVTIDDGTGANPVVNITLKSGYVENYATNPPLVFVNLSGVPKNVTINIMNQDTTIKKIKATKDSEFETYEFSPYIFLNWTEKQTFTWGWQSEYKISVNGIVNPNDGTNKINKLTSGHIINNFPNMTGDFIIDGQVDNQLISGTILTPNASQFTVKNYASGANYFGNIVTGGDLEIDNNITAERSLVSRFDADGLSTDTIEKLDPNNPDNQPQKLKSVRLNSGTKSTTVDETQLTASFDYDDADAALKPLPNSGIQATLNITDPADKYHLFYRILTGAKKGKWHQYQSDLSGKTQTIPDLEALLFRDDDYRILPQETAQVASADNSFNYQLQRQNKIEFGVATTGVSTVDLDSDGTQLSSQLTFDLTVQGSLRIAVPESLDFGSEQLGQSGASEVQLPLNTVNLNQLKVGNQGTTTTPEIMAYNPMQVQYNLALQRITAGQTPFSLPNNLAYQLSNQTSGATGTYAAIVNPDNQSPIGIMADTGIAGNRSDLIPANNRRYLYFKLPFSNRYAIGTHTADLKWQLTL